MLWWKGGGMGWGSRNLSVCIFISYSVYAISFSSCYSEHHRHKKYIYTLFRSNFMIFVFDFQVSISYLFIYAASIRPCYSECQYPQ